MQAFLSPPSYNSHQSSFHQVATFRKAVFLTLDALACWRYQPHAIKIGCISLSSWSSDFVNQASQILFFSTAQNQSHFPLEFWQLNCVLLPQLRQVSGNKSKWNEPFNEQPPLLQQHLLQQLNKTHILQKRVKIHHTAVAGWKYPHLGWYVNILLPPASQDRFYGEETWGEIQERLCRLRPSQHFVRTNAALVYTRPSSCPRARLLCKVYCLLPSWAEQAERRASSGKCQCAQQ